jgi:hypothetical protein
MLLKRIVIAGGVVLAAACSTEQAIPTELEMSAPLFVKGGNSHINLETHLTGDEEVLVVSEGAPHPRDSRAQGQAIFRVDGNSVHFRLIASNIENVVQAHIHCGRPGENGPIRMWLFPDIGTSGTALTPGNLGRQNGVLASGTFSHAGVVCPAANVGTDMPLIEAIRAGLTYVNVHTNNGGTANTGPGDFPGGEIRGQID